MPIEIQSCRSRDATACMISDHLVFAVIDIAKINLNRPRERSGLRARSAAHNPSTSRIERRLLSILAFYKRRFTSTEIGSIPHRTGGTPRSYRPPSLVCSLGGIITNTVQNATRRNATPNGQRHAEGPTAKSWGPDSHETHTRPASSARNRRPALRRHQP